MKFCQLLAFCLLASFLSLTYAAQTGKDCETQAKRIEKSKQDAFLKNCLAQTSSESNVREFTQQEKRKFCEQNAKNLQLNGGNKASYLEDCMHKNEAELAAKKHSHPARATQLAATRSKSAPAPAGPSANKQTRAGSLKECSRQAKAQGLKGAERKKFMRGCRHG